MSRLQSSVLFYGKYFTYFAFIFVVQFKKKENIDKLQRLPKKDQIKNMVRTVSKSNRKMVETEVKWRPP
jgi:hypothetical protein